MSNTMTLSEQLFDSTARVLEEMCFLFPEHPEKTIPDSLTPDATSVISFDGPRAGEMIIMTYGGILPEIAENMTGNDELCGEKQLDALGEFANVLCGNFLPLISEKGSVYTIHHPEVFTETDSFGSIPSPSATTDITTDAGNMKIHLFL